MTDDTYLFVSDLHLGADAPEAVAQFLAFLKADARDADALYILGDLFEAWVGDDDAEEARDRVCRALREFAATTPLFVLRGNRDFLFGPGFEARTGATLLPDPVLLEVGEVRALVSHGDLFCTDDHRYQALRAMVREAAWQARFLGLPLATRRVVADAARAGSKAHTRSTMRSIMDVNEPAVLAGMRASGARMLIHGHTHRPAIHRFEVDGEAAVRIVLGDWYDQGSVLTMRNDGSYELKALDREE